MVGIIKAIERLQGTVPGGVIRTLGLWVLILGAGGSIFLLFATGEPIWTEVLALIAVFIGFKEAFGMIVGFREPDGTVKKMTISTAYRRYIERVGRIAYIPLALFWIAMSGLVIHLLVWGGDKDKKK